MLSVKENIIHFLCFILSSLVTVNLAKFSNKSSRKSCADFSRFRRPSFQMAASKPESSSFPANKPESSSSFLLVGAIDFGTTYSGWAYSFKHDYQSDPTRVFVQHWHSGSSTLVTEKTPTVALIAPDGKTLVAFGYEAENKYKELVEEDKHRDYYYFRRFKMALNKETISRYLKIQDEMGKSLSAMKVFSLSIDYLADSLVKFGKDKIAGLVTRDDVHWVLTVPAIWTDAAKQFMRKAAEEAKIKSEQLTIALEPEAASVFCRHLPSDRLENIPSVSVFSAGTRYLVLDAGGGTIDITVHETSFSGGLKEIHAASGGGWGGVLVDEAFKDLLVELLGRRTYEKFTQEETEDWVDLWRTFEVKKKTVDPNKNSKTNMTFPLSLLELYKRESGHDLEERIKGTKYAAEIDLRKNKMMFSSAIMRSLFDKSVKTTVSHVKKVLQDGTVANVQAILMVGGFSDSPMLKESIKRDFSYLKVISPNEASSAIMRGAVIFGHNPSSITHRVLKKTYGIEVDEAFIYGVHPLNKLKIIEGREQCMKVFNKHVEAGQTVKVGEAQVEKLYFPSSNENMTEELIIYASDLKNPKFVDEGCSHVGQMTIDLSRLPKEMGRLEKELKISLCFSDTEIKAVTRIVKTGQILTGTFDFLG